MTHMDANERGGDDARTGKTNKNCQQTIRGGGARIVRVTGKTNGEVVVW